MSLYTITKRLAALAVRKVEKSITYPSPAGVGTNCNPLTAIEKMIAVDFGLSDTAVKIYQESWLIYTCIKLIIGGCDATDFGLFKNGDETEVKGDPLVNKLKNKVNDTYTGKELRRQCLTDYLLTGEQYILNITTASKKPIELFRIPKSKLAINQDISDPSFFNPIQEFLFTDTDGGQKKFTKDEICFSYNFDPSSSRGLSQLSPSSKAIALDLAIDNWNLTLVKNGGRNNVVFSTDERLTQLNREELKNSYTDIFKPLVFDGGLKPFSISQGSGDLDYTAAQIQMIRKVAGVFGINPILLNDPDGRTYENLKSAKIDLYTDTVFPLLQNFFDMLSNFYYYNESTGMVEKELQVKKNSVPIIKESSLKNMAVLQNSWWVKSNEKRELSGLPKDENLKIDYLVPAGMENIEDIGYTDQEEEV